MQHSCMMSEALSPAAVSMLRRLDPACLRFAMQGARLQMTEENGAVYSPVRLARLFPLSDPDHFISVRDAENREVGVLVDLAGLEASSFAVVRAELERRYLLPVIQRIVTIRERFGTVDWTVITDRGPRVFTMRNIQQSVVKLTPGRYILSDVEGNRYDIADLARLDARSRAHLKRFL